MHREKMFRIVAAVTCLLLLLGNVHCSQFNSTNEHKGYIFNKADGHGYKIMDRAKSWENAKKCCAEDGAKLAVPKTEEQFTFVQNLVKGTHYPSIVGTHHKLVVYVGVSNLENYKILKNVDGENFEDTDFHSWAGLYNGIPFSDDPTQPHCAAMDGLNHGLREFWCHLRQPYICEIQSDNRNQTENPMAYMYNMAFVKYIFYRQKPIKIFKL